MEQLLLDSEELTLPGGFKHSSNLRPRRVWPDHGPLGFQNSYPNPFISERISAMLGQTDTATLLAGKKTATA
jgi:hypothetical protein